MFGDLNGSLLNADETEIDVSNPGAILGDGVYEYLRIKNGTVKRFDSHMNCLRAGAAAQSLTVPTTDAAIATRLKELLTANDMQSAAVRLTVTAGSDSDGGVQSVAPGPSLFMTAEPLPVNDPVRAVLSSSVVRDAKIPLEGVWTLNDPIVAAARDEASDQGVEETLVLNNHGRLAEAIEANVFLLIDGRLITPAEIEGAHPNTVRKDLLTRFRGQEAVLAVDDLQRAEEAFLVNSLGIRPLIDVAGQPIGDGEPGLVTQMLAARV